jgi:hypothetical protein
VSTGATPDGIQSGCTLQFHLVFDSHGDHFKQDLRARSGNRSFSHSTKPPQHCTSILMTVTDFTAFALIISASIPADLLIANHERFMHAQGFLQTLWLVLALIQIFRIF